jgi:hypothetical protein
MLPVPQTVRTAVKPASGLFAVPNDAASAMRTQRRQQVNGTLETVECVSAPRQYNLKGFGIVIAAGIAFLFHITFGGGSRIDLHGPYPNISCRMNGIRETGLQSTGHGLSIPAFTPRAGFQPLPSPP